MPTATPTTVTGVQLMQGIGVTPAKGFWADAWSHVLGRPFAVIGLTWVGVIVFFAVFAPVLASGHPLVFTRLGPGGEPLETTYPLVRHLTALDVLLLALALIGLPFAFFAPVLTRAKRLSWVFALFALALLVVVVSSYLATAMNARSPAPWLRSLRGTWYAPWVVIGIGSLLALGAALLAPIGGSSGGKLPRRLLAAALGLTIGAGCVLTTWDRPVLERFQYREAMLDGQAQGAFTLIPFSPQQRFSALSREAPGTTLGDALQLDPGAPTASQTFFLGTDAFGADVLSQLLHACRLSISIGLVSTGIALIIGVTLGALMGYFGGWVDLVLFRVVEIFMAVPVLFLLIVAVAVLPPEARTTYAMMAIIGCFSWTGMARFTRAEFLKLRNQDFVQSAKAVGLPLRSVLFKHMLPNGVAPVLVDTSFAIAAAITIEAVLSYLNLGPIDQASWGRLLASAVSQEGEFKWWLAVFPGLAIFLTVLSYNLIGEALRDAIDPKLKKARV